MHLFTGVGKHRLTVLSLTAVMGVAITLMLALVWPVSGQNTDEGAPAQPTGLTGAVSSEAVSLSWDDPGDSSITGYQVLRRNPAVDARGVFETIANSAAPGTSYTDTTAAANTRYFYQVKARNSAGLSAQSNLFSASVPAPEPEPEPTPAPTPEPGIDYARERTESVSLGDITDDPAVNRDGTVDTADTVDYFHFSLTAKRDVGVRIRRLDYNADLYIEDNDGTAIASSENTGDSKEVLNVTLSANDAGEHYYVRIEGKEDGTNDYQFRYFAEAPPNVTATGQSTISGTAQVQETLTASTTDIADDNGLSGATFVYQWVRSANGTDTDVAGATSSTFPLTQGELDHTVTVRVSFTDDAGYTETVTSAATAAVARQPNVSPSGLPTIRGVVAVGKTLTANTSGITDGNGLTGASFTYQWVRTIASVDADIPGATGSTHTITASDAGAAFKIRVAFTDDDGYSETLTSNATGTVVQPPNQAASGQPTITGTAEVGETLTAGTSGITDGNGLSSVQYAYQWIGSSGGTDTDISDATGSTYILTADDLADTIKVRVSFTDDDGYSETLTSNATGAVSRPPNVAASGQPAITGTVQVGETLTASTAGISDGNGTTNVQYAYQWIGSSGGTDTDISGATGSTYILTADDLAHTIKVQVNFTDDDGYTETLTSAATDAVNRPPNTTASGQPTITGTVEVGETLTGRHLWHQRRERHHQRAVRLPVDPFLWWDRHGYLGVHRRHLLHHFFRCRKIFQGAGQFHR